MYGDHCTISWSGFFPTISRFRKQTWVTSFARPELSSGKFHHSISNFLRNLDTDIHGF